VSAPYNAGILSASDVCRNRRGSFPRHWRPCCSDRRRPILATLVSKIGKEALPGGTFPFSMNLRALRKFAASKMHWISPANAAAKAHR
jgi:hypothetical protein